MIEFRLPSLGSDMDQGKLVEWQVQPGDSVRKGQVVAVVDTAKAAIDVECWHDGVVHALLTEPGETIAVGTLMAVLRAPGENAAAADRQWAALRAAPPAQPAGVGPPAMQAAPATAGAVVAASGERQRVSPAARRRAQQLGVELAAVAGSGADGAITLGDVEAAAAGQTVAAPTAAVAPTRAQQMRQVIAAAMARSKREIPHYYLADDIAFERAASWLAERNQGLPATQRLLPAALLLKAVARALQRYPEFNGFYRNGGFVASGAITLGVAISLREGGLVAPALHGADTMDVATLTRALLDLVKRTRAAALRSSELADATITVTNLGEQSVASVFGIIYPPQVALVGFGRIALRPWAFDDGMRALPALTATLAADHRASDGHRGALLLAEIGNQLQAPEALDTP
jgi:pyruvate dehydrogenase E2 component (dihydrolipoamide acetyltransferase)